MTRSKKDAALEEAWRAAAKAVGGQFSKPLYPFGAAVQVRSGIHRLTLSATQVQNSGDTAGATWITRVRTLLLSDDSFSFSVYPADEIA